MWWSTNSSSGTNETLQVELPVGKLTTDQFRALLRALPLDNDGTTAFHVACRTAAPVEILELLLQEYPGAMQIADNSGCFPLHCACQARTPSLAVLQFLLQQDPAAVRACDNTGSLPLHHLCGSKPPDDIVDFLLAANEGSISVRANNGYLPLMVACRSRASHSVVGTLLRTYPYSLQYIVQEFDPDP